MQARKAYPRRNVLKALGSSAIAASIGFSTAACTPSTNKLARYTRPHSRNPFVAPRLSQDRIIRTIVGSRPYRPSGFVVKREKYNNKNIVHNYGHGGGGITMAWGSSALAMREISDLPPGRAAVIGSGIMGLTSARLLQEAGWKVSIYTRRPARHSTSNVGAGQWAPSSVFDEKIVTSEFKTRFNWAARVAHHAYTNLGPSYGVKWMENYYLGNEPIKPSYYLKELPELFPSVADLEPGQHPFPVPHVRRMVTMLIEPGMFLRQVFEDFLQAHGNYVVQNFQSIEQVLMLNEPVIFNCTGMGAKALFGDEELIPIKGQLVFLPPDPAVDYLTIGGGTRTKRSDTLYMFPRSDAIVLGGTWKRDDYSQNTEPEETQRILKQNKNIFDNLA